MELIETIKRLGIDPVIVILIIAGGFSAKRYLASLTKIQIGKFVFNFNDAWKTLVVGTIFTTVYILVLKFTGELERNMFKSFFYSYVFATSFYELLVGPVVKFIGDKIKSGNSNTN